MLIIKGEKYYSVLEMGKYFCFGGTTAYKFARSGDIEITYFNERRYFSETALNRFIEAHTIPAITLSERRALQQAKLPIPSPEKRLASK